MDKKIRCEECGKQLAHKKGKKLIIRGKTDLVEDENGKVITCTVCKTPKKIK